MSGGRSPSVGVSACAMPFCVWAAGWAAGAGQGLRKRGTRSPCSTLGSEPRALDCARQMLDAHCLLRCERSFVKARLLLPNCFAQKSDALLMFTTLALLASRAEAQLFAIAADLPGRSGSVVLATFTLLTFVSLRLRSSRDTTQARRKEQGLGKCSHVAAPRNLFTSPTIQRRCRRLGLLLRLTSRCSSCSASIRCDPGPADKRSHKYP